MSILSVSSAFTLNARSQGLFSSHSAFKKPSFNNTFNKPSDNYTRLTTPAHPKDLAYNLQKPVKICNISQDPEVLLCNPVKKVKLTKGESLCVDPMNNKTQQTTVRSSKLTIEEVFNTPVECKDTRKFGLMEDCFDEGSSLSFISSHSSLDDLDYEEPIKRKHSDCMIIGVEKKSIGGDLQQSLVMKDDVVGRLSYLNQETISFNNIETQFFGQESLYKLVDVSNVSGLRWNGPLCMPPNNMNEYMQLAMQNQHMSLSDKVISELVKLSSEDGYDSDSYATRSTSVEQETGEKGASPIYSGNEDLLYVKGNVNDKAMKKEKVNRVTANNNKEKKGRSLNLKLDVNPKQLKVQRRLNRLQLIRYQQGATEEEHEDLKQFGISDLLSRGNSTIQEDNNEDIQEPVVNVFDPEYSKAVIPQIGEENIRRKRAPLMAIWTPEAVEEEMFEEYLRQLGDILENPVSDIEAAIKLLRSSGMDISMALEAVKGNIALYSEMFRLKVKRLRRRGA